MLLCIHCVSKHIFLITRADIRLTLNSVSLVTQRPEEMRTYVTTKQCHLKHSSLLSHVAAEQHRVVEYHI